MGTKIRQRSLEYFLGIQSLLCRVKAEKPLEPKPSFFNSAIASITEEHCQDMSVDMSSSKVTGCPPGDRVQIKYRPSEEARPPGYAPWAST
jgi:hypothetical protein